MAINTKSDASVDQVNNFGAPASIGSLVLFALSFPLSMLCVYLFSDDLHHALGGILVVVVDTIYFWIFFLLLSMVLGLFGYFKSTKRLLTLSPVLFSAFLATYLAILLSVNPGTETDTGGIVGVGDTDDKNSVLGTNRDDSSAPVNMVTSNVTVTNVNDWGSGFQVQHDCPVPAGINSVKGFDIGINYNGAGSITNSWLQGYNGGINTGLSAADGGYRITSNNYVPPLSSGNQITFIVQVQGAGYIASEFEAQCTITAE